MNEVARGTYLLRLEKPYPSPGEQRIVRRVLVHDFSKSTVPLRHRIEMMLLELRKLPGFRRPGEYGAWRGTWVVAHEDWRLFLQEWEAHDTLKDVQCGTLFGYPVVES